MKRDNKHAGSSGPVRVHTLAKAKANHEIIIKYSNQLILNVCFPQGISRWTSPLGSKESLSD